MSETSSKKRKLSLPLVLAGGVSSLVLALGMSPTFSAFSAAIQNTVNQANTGAIVMEESNTVGSLTTTCKSTDGGGISTNSATCATINKYGGALLTPGGSSTTTVVIKNSGTVAAASFSLTPGACTQVAIGSVSGTAADLCTKINVKVTTGSTTVYDGAASAFAGAKTLTPLAVGGTASYTFVVSLATGADNSYQGLQASQPLTWTFSA